MWLKGTAFGPSDQASAGLGCVSMKRPAPPAATAALASTGTMRLSAFPKIPTIAESGFPGFSATNWYAFVASSKVPQAILDRWNTELVKVLKNPEVIEQLNSHGLIPQPSTRDEFAKYMAKETATWGRVIRDRKITVD